MPPLLLISVRDAAEAVIAIESGADIVDIKDPARGALGRATNEVVSHIVAAIDSRSATASVPVTMALGELRELNRDTFEVPRGISALKLGLAGCADRRDWRCDWADFKASCEAQTSLSPDWVGVAYADSRLAESPAAMDVIRASSELGCRGVLVDTYSKAAGRLWDFVDLATFQEWTSAIHKQGMFVAVAGSLRAGDLSRMGELPLDIVAVRGGVCVHGERSSTVDAGRIQDFRRAMKAAWPSLSNHSLLSQRQHFDQPASLSLAHRRLAVSGRGRE